MNPKYEAQLKRWRFATNDHGVFVSLIDLDGDGEGFHFGRLWFVFPDDGDSLFLTQWLGEHPIAANTAQLLKEMTSDQIKEKFDLCRFV